MAFCLTKFQDKFLVFVNVNKRRNLICLYIFGRYVTTIAVDA